jgi:hypothetical protein
MHVAFGKKDRNVPKRRGLCEGSVSGDIVKHMHECIERQIRLFPEKKKERGR